MLPLNPAPTITRRLFIIQEISVLPYHFLLTVKYVLITIQLLQHLQRHPARSATYSQP